MVQEIEFTAIQGARQGAQLVDSAPRKDYWGLSETFVHYGALTSSFFWPPASRSKRLTVAFPDRGADLREHFGLDEASPFGGLRDIRNSVMHLDERYEEFWLDNAEHSLAVRNFGDPTMVMPNTTLFIFWDPNGEVLTFGGSNINVRDATLELTRIASRAAELLGDTGVLGSRTLDGHGGGGIQVRDSYFGG